jgi:uncharacterized membrane protein YhaH (DUF805 family)
MTAARNCGNCGATLSEEASFCKSCGSSVHPRNDMKCQTCGNDNEENAQFCEGCGASLSSGRVTARPGLPTVGFGEAISRDFTNYFTFSGRASRTEYWWWVLGAFIFWLIPFWGLVILIPTLAVTSRRLHDIGKSGWLQILPLGGLILGLLLRSAAAVWLMGLMALLVSLVLFLGSIVLLIVWLAKKSDEGPNKYGPDPRQATSQQPYRP